MSEMQTTTPILEKDAEMQREELENSSKNLENESELIRLCADARRAAYMISWRDRVIENLRAQLQGHEELASLFEALLAFALFRMAKADPDGRCFVATVPKAELRELLTSWQSEVRDGDEAYTVIFTEKRCDAHGEVGAAE